MGLSVKPMPLSELLTALWAENPKGHDHGILDASMRDSGFVDTPILDERTGQLLGGHGRVMHLRQMREAGETPPEHVVKRKDGEWMVPVQRGVKTRDDDHAARMALALNRATERGGWKDGMLGPILERLSKTEAGLEATGFTDDDLEALLARLGREAPADPPTAPAEDDGGGSDEGDEDDDPPPSHVRMVHLFLDVNSEPLFQERVDKLREAWGIDNVTDAVFEAVRREHAQLQ